MQWGKHYVGMVSDPKHDAAAKIAGVPKWMPRILWDSLFERAVENGDGTISGFQPIVFAAQFDVALDDVQRVLSAFIELAMLAGERLLNWAKRQGRAASEAVAAAPAQRVSSAVLRQRRYAEKKRAHGLQGSLMFSIDGGVSNPSATPSSGVISTVSVTGREERETESLKNKEGGHGRCAPSEERAPSTAEEIQAVDRAVAKMQVVVGGRGGKLRDPLAYQGAVADQKFRRWLASLNQWISGNLNGAARLLAWEAVAIAERAGERAKMSREERAAVDALDGMMRQARAA